MKKIIGWFVCCLSASSVWSMKELNVDSDEQKDQQVHALKLRAALSVQEQEELVTCLHDSFYDCDDVKKLLDLGADPNGVFYFSPLRKAAQHGRPDLVKLLLTYGADLNLDHDNGPPIVRAANIDVLRLLVRAGADINAQGVCLRCPTMKNVLFYMITYDRFTDFVWALQHGADPNSFKRRFSIPRCFALHEALSCCDIAAVIVLLQFGARLDVEGADEYKKPLDWAIYLSSCSYDLLSSSESSLQDLVKRAKAQYELLRVFSEHPFDMRQTYGVAEYKTMGISHESAELIQKATQEVNDAFAQCAFDDFKYEHGEGVVEFLRNRELGAAGKRRR